MSDYQFERECRTPYSEGYVIILRPERLQTVEPEDISGDVLQVAGLPDPESQGDEIGRVDIHYSDSAAYATLCVPESLTDQDIRDLVSEIDERLVLTADPFREDLAVTVWAGREAAFFSDDAFEDEDDGEDDDEG